MDVQREVATPSRRPPSGTLTFEAFLAWCDEDTWAEWVDGEVLLLTPNTRRHQELVGLLYRLFAAWAEAHDLGVVLVEPFLVRLPGPARSARLPDLLFVAHEHRDRLTETFLDGAADLVVEIVSPESAARDRGEKFVEYEAAGVSEYWLIDPDRQQAEFYRLGPDGRYHLAQGGSAGSYESAVLAGFRLPVEWLWQQPLPKVREALRALGLP
ncbi:MAG: Uma2 family endonuclease [Chloroflexi bacterium]|nr:Uma2 family endonuclease [Chloroflexota bacterium]